MAVVERLCIHHDISSFRCASEPDFVRILRQLHADANMGVLPRAYAAIVQRAGAAAQPVLDVTGFVSANDIFLGAENPERFLYIGNLAISDHHRHFTQTWQLLRHIRDLFKALRAQGKDYAGYAATPGDNERLIRALEGRVLRFKRLDGEDSSFWIRRE